MDRSKQCWSFFFDLDIWQEASWVCSAKYKECVGRKNGSCIKLTAKNIIAIIRVEVIMLIIRVRVAIIVLVILRLITYK